MKKFTICFVLLLLTSCIKKEYTSGVPIRPHQYEQIKNAQTKQDVFAILGSPAAINFVGDEKWFYYTSSGEIFAFLDPEFNKYEILSIGFDKDNKIKNIKLNNLKDKDFACNKEVKTNLPSDIELNFFQELFGNIGRFNAGGMGQ